MLLLRTKHSSTYLQGFSILSHFWVLLLFYENRRVWTYSNITECIFIGIRIYLLHVMTITNYKWFLSNGSYQPNQRLKVITLIFIWSFLHKSHLNNILLNSRYVWVYLRIWRKQTLQEKNEHATWGRKTRTGEGRRETFSGF